MAAAESFAVGIDLGTTYSCVGVFRNGEVEIIANELGERTTPSYVAFTEEDLLIGQAAKNQGAQNPQNTVFDAKRLIGLQVTDPAIQEDLKHWPFKVVAGEAGRPLIEVQHEGQTKQFRPEEISSFVLNYLRKTAENYLGGPVSGAVITVPAYFSDSQRSCTKLAGELAGLKVLRIINEPTAAAIAYGLDRVDEDALVANLDLESDDVGDEEKLVLVFDLGGGTFDVSLLSINMGFFEVKATAGDSHLGGEDFDLVLMKWAIQQFSRKDPSLKDKINARGMRRLRTACERAKRTLSAANSATIEVDTLADGVDLHVTLSRARFEDLLADHFKRCLLPVAQVLTDCQIPKQRVDEIVLVGGSTRIPKVQQLISEYFGGKEVNTRINPDEAVAFGAAVQAAVLTGQTDERTEDLLLVDVTPLSLGVETAGGMMSVLVKRNSTIPAKATKLFSTDADYQDAVDICIYQGERAKVAENSLLDKITLTGIPPLPAGVPRIEVVIELDADGILHVSASEKTSGKVVQVQIGNEQLHRLSQEQVMRMLDEAEKFKAEDTKIKQRNDAMNLLLAYHAEVTKFLEDPRSSGKLAPYQLDELKEIYTQTSEWVESKESEEANVELIDEKREALEKICRPLIFGGKSFTAEELKRMRESKNLLTHRPGGGGSSALGKRKQPEGPQDQAGPAQRPKQ